MKAGSKYTWLVVVATAALCASARAGILTNLQVQAVPFSATEGIPFYNARVATFTDPGEIFPSYLTGPVYEVTNYSATITWGDGSGPYPATLVPGFPGIDVIGTHTYTEHGGYPIMVQVSDIDGSSGSTNFRVTVCDARLRAHGVLASAVEATEFTSIVATFTDANPYGTIGDFTATIDWGDKTPLTLGTIVTNESGGFAVMGTHTYAHQRSYGYHVKIEDVGGSRTWASGTVCVSDAPLIAAAIDISCVEGSPFSGFVATFTHADTNASKGDFAAVISWGDELSLAGDVVPYGPPGSFAVYGAHIYTNAGSYTLGVDINSRGGSAAHLGATATIGDAKLMASGVDIAGTEGFGFVDTVVATFTDENPYATPVDFLPPVINWGDGTDPTPGVISGNGVDGFTVTGSHVYVDAGSFRITVVIHDIGGAEASAGATATIADAALFVTANPLSLVEGSPFTSVIATFVDENPLSDPADLTAVIEWGDGGTSLGVITPVEVKGLVVGRSYSVAGTHTYTSWDSYGFNVTVSDSGGYVASAGNTATVSDAPLTSLARVITPTENTSFLAVVASFSDANPYGTTNEVKAYIDWSDGTTVTPGTVIANTAVNTGNAEFIVLGSHQYANQGLYPLRVTIQSDGGSQTAASSAAVTADAPMIGFGKTISVVKGVAFTNVVANCVDTDTSPEPETTYNCIINWGDGSTSIGTVMEGDEDSYAVSGSHTYMQTGSYVVLATIDNTQTFVSTTARGTANVSETPAADVTAQFVVKATRPVFNKRTGLYRQTMTVRNISREAVSGPVSVVLDNLSSDGGSAVLFNKDGETLTPGAAPLGSPYKNVILPKGSLFKGRNTRTLILHFRSSSPAITYNARVLAGPGAR
jgi:hypothetical protein